MQSSLPVILSVPYAEKNDARMMGAYWDHANRLWMVPAGTDPRRFQKRWHTVPYRSCSAPEWYIAETRTGCSKCAEKFTVHAIVLPAGTTVWDGDRAYSLGKAHFVSKPRWIDPKSTQRIRACNPHLKQAYSKTVEHSYWMNHCPECSFKKGAFFLFEDAVAFCPIRPEDYERITLKPIHESIQLHESELIEIDRLDWMYGETQVVESEAIPQSDCDDVDAFNSTISVPVSHNPSGTWFLAILFALLLFWFFF